MNKILRFLEKWVLVPILLLIFITMLLQVFSRYVIGNPVRWTVELANLCLIWLTFLGAAICYWKDGMVKLDIFYNMFPKKWKWIISLLQDLVFVVVGLFLIQHAYRLAIMESTRSLHTIPVSRAIRFIPVVIGFVMLVSIGFMRIKKKLLREGE